MPTPNLPPEWVQQALRAEVKAAFGADAVLSFTQGRAAVVVTAGTPRFTLPVLQSAFGDSIAAGDELELELFWQPVDGPERAAQQSEYGTTNIRCRSESAHLDHLPRHTQVSRFAPGAD